MIRIKELDENGLCKPRYDWGNSGNGVTYSVVAMCLFPSYFNARILDCWDHKRQVLMRTPDNKYGQNSHDDYTSLSIYCLIYNQHWARAYLLSAIKKLGFMQNDFKEEGAFWKSQMFRFPQIWIIMFAAAFPHSIVRWISGLLCSGLLRFQKANVHNASGTQLTFLIAHAALLMGNDQPMRRFLNQIKAESTTLANIMRDYYDLGHSIVDGYESYERNFK